MWKKIRNWVNKAYLAQELRGRGICLRHGTKLYPDRSHGTVGYDRVVPPIMTCQECEDEHKALVEKLSQHFEAETAAMWKEYKSL